MVETMQSPEYMQRGFVHEPQGDSPPQPELKQRHRIDKDRYIRHTSWDIRMHRWVRSWWVWQSDYKDGVNRWAWFRRMRLWVFGYQNASYGQYEMARKFFVAITGGLVGKDEYAERMNVCGICPSLRVQLPRKAGQKPSQFCGSCGCSNWMLSELAVKNKLRKWHCPEHRHSGEYPADWVRGYIRNLQTELDVIAPPPSNGKD